ncbi:MAG: FHA domain-containing protein [Chloroflexota bacterium]|nr:FHA domain-containing protein [Chloroflexota bacterium]
MQLVVQTGPDAGKVFNLDRPLLIAGRQVGNEMVLNDTQVSRRHIQLELRNGQVFISDLGSANGTNVNGQSLLPNQPRLLMPGDLVQLGNTALVFNVAPAPAPTLGYSPNQPTYYNPNPPFPNPPANFNRPTPSKVRQKNFIIPILIGLLLIGGVLFGLTTLQKNNNAGNANTDTKNQPGVVNNPIQTIPPPPPFATPTVVRGLNGTNSPPPPPAQRGERNSTHSALITFQAETTTNLALRWSSG